MTETPPENTPTETAAQPSAWDELFKDQDPAKVKAALENSRKWEARAKENAEKAKAHDAYVESQATEQEKAVKAAREEAAVETRAAEAARTAPRLVMAEFRVAAAGRLDAARLGVLTEDIDLTRYLTDDGEVDADKVAKKVEAWAPAGEQRRGPKPDHSVGPRGGAKVLGADGAAEARRRFGDKAGSK